MKHFDPEDREEDHNGDLAEDSSPVGGEAFEDSTPSDGQVQPSADRGPAPSGVEISPDDLRWAGVLQGDDSQPNADRPSDGDDSWLSAEASSVGVAVQFRDGTAEPRVAATKRALNDALDNWWREGVVPSATLLRDGLLLLNAGYDIDDAQRAFLLRISLYYQRGMLTALAQQRDAERTAVILHDAIVDSQHGLSAPEVDRLLQDDPDGDRWAPYLLADLRTTASATDPIRRQRAATVLAVIDSSQAIAGTTTGAVDATAALTEMLQPQDRGRRRGVLIISLAAVLVLLLISAAFWQYERGRTAGMIEIPGGRYTLTDADGTTRTADIADFLLDATETTNGHYRRCVRRGSCPAPSAQNSATHPHYFDDPAFDDYPVIYVDHRAAEAFCAWSGKRLPTFDEWQLAAGLAPATQRNYRFPWGDRYVAGVANDASASHGDVLAVGAYRPVGDSPLGLSDMAGNVAEWTATAGSETANIFWVKGGSYADGAANLRTDAGFALLSTEAGDSVGFRCATELLRDRWTGWLMSMVGLRALLG